MESANLYHHNHQLQLQQGQQGQQHELVYSSLAPSSSSSSARVSTVNDQWNPSMVLDGDDFNRYMTEILPNSREYFWPKNINSFPSVKKSLLEVDDQDTTKSCDFSSYVHHPLIYKGRNTSDCFLKLSDMNGSILKNSYIKNDQQYGIDLNENLWINGSFSHGITNQKLSTDNNNSYLNAESFDRFAGLAAPSTATNYISSFTSEGTARHHLCGSTSLLPASPGLPSTTEILNYRNYDEGRAQSFGEGTSSGYFHAQRSSDSPSNSSNKTSTFRKEVVPRRKNPKPTPSQDVAKKPRVTPSSCPTLKVRKEKLGDRIAALHRLVSPFGKTDTASVLTEAIGYIQFLQDQIQTLSMSYLKSSGSKSCRTTRGELLTSMKDQKDVQHELPMQDLKSRGLCLVPLAFTSYLCCSYNGSI